MDNIDKTEKITINIGVVDLGKIDLLVEQGFYSNRTDFIKTSVRNQISTHQQFIEQKISSKVIAAGVVHYNQSELEEYYNQNKTLDIRLIGMLIFDADVTPEMVLKTVRIANIFGVIKASAPVKAAIETIKKNSSKKL